MTLSPISSKEQLQSRETMCSLQKLYTFQRRVAKVIMVKPVKAAKFRRVIREIIRIIGRQRIGGSAFIANSQGISPRTAWERNVVILHQLLTPQQKHQLSYRLLQLSPHQSRTIGSWLAEMLHAVIGSLIADARLTSPAIKQCSSPTPNIMWIRIRWRDTIGSHRSHPDMCYGGNNTYQRYFVKYSRCIRP